MFLKLFVNISGGGVEPVNPAFKYGPDFLQGPYNYAALMGGL